MLVKAKEPVMEMTVTEDPRELYHAIGRGRAFDEEVSAAKRDAKQWRDMVKGKKRPPGFGERIFTIPDIILERLRIANRAMYLQQPKKFWCMVWHTYADFRTTHGRCPWCGRS